MVILTSQFLQYINPEIQRFTWRQKNPTIQCRLDFFLISHILIRKNEQHTKGVIIRSKIRWYNEGEKNAKYFLNLEKRHFKQGTINGLKAKDGAHVSSDKEILKQCEIFYKSLYRSKIDNDENPLNNRIIFEDENLNILSREEQK